MRFVDCTVCKAKECILLHETLDTSRNPVAMFVCGRCCMLIPSYGESTISQENMTLKQGEFHETYWSTFDRAEADTLKDELRGLVASQRPRLGPPSQDTPVTELGAGRGGLMAALHAEGYPVVGCEPSPGLFALATELYDLPAGAIRNQDALSFLDDMEKEGSSLGHVFLWHVIEHVSEPLDLLRRIASAMKPYHFLIGQAPCLRPDYVYPEHVFFATEPGLLFIARASGFDVDEISFDHVNDFVTFVFRRQSSPVPASIEEVEATELKLPQNRMDELRQENESARSDCAAARALAVERLAVMDRMGEMIARRDEDLSRLWNEIEGRRVEIEATYRQRIDALELEVADLNDALRKYEKTFSRQLSRLARSPLSALKSLLNR